MIVGALDELKGKLKSHGEDFKKHNDNMIDKIESLGVQMKKKRPAVVSPDIQHELKKIKTDSDSELDPFEVFSK